MNWTKNYLSKSRKTTDISMHFETKKVDTMVSNSYDVMSTFYL